jgi:hypothetical protein
MDDRTMAIIKQRYGSNNPLEYLQTDFWKSYSSRMQLSFVANNMDCDSGIIFTDDGVNDFYNEIISKVYYDN